MNVLSLFDGQSCGQIALERAGFNISRYFASEVDKHAIKVAMSNYPNTVQLGDVTKWRGWNLPSIDLLIGGSPCQGFSFAGKQLAFDDPRSKLFFEFVECLKHFKPRYFLLENVRMKKEHMNVISEILGVEPICINSALVSAQNRVRFYWTNIPEITQPADKGIFLKDVLQNEADEKYTVVGKAREYLIRNFDVQVKKKYSAWDADKAKTMVARQYASWTGNFVRCGAIRGRYAEDGSIEQRLEIRPDEKTNTITTVQKDNIILTRPRGNNTGGIFSEKSPTVTSSSFEHNVSVVCVKEATKKGYVEVKAGQCVDLTFPSSKTRRGRLMDKKSNCLTASTFDFNHYNGWDFRKLTPVECERLQTVPDNYTAAVSDSQRYRMLGNGWTVDVIAHIFKHMPKIAAQ